MDFRVGFSIESYAKPKNFRSIGAMKRFSWPFEKMDFRVGFSIESYTKPKNFRSIGAMKLFYGHLKKWTSELDSALRVIPNRKILGQ